MESPERALAFAKLKTDIIRFQGLMSNNCQVLDSKLGPLRASLPGGSFPLGAVHEFLIKQPEEAAATSGFIGLLLGELAGDNGIVLWISSARTLFPAALRSFNLQPDHFIFIDLEKEHDVIWAMDEALKCSGVRAVVGELKEISFTQSRRLQLAVEQSKVTGFILRNSLRDPGTTACVSRWRITASVSEPIAGLPGLGYPKWKVELLRMRNGKSGWWYIHWKDGRFIIVQPQESNPLASDFESIANKKVG